MTRRLAIYWYGPFGEVIRATGPMAKLNSFRFSTKYDDDESDFFYYDYRYYNPSTGRWLNRDPIQENGGQNLYGLVGNDPVGQFDYFGLWYIMRNPSENWAQAFADDGDTVQSLADTIHLNANEAHAWLKGWSGGDINDARNISTCHTYEIPNTVVVYTSKPHIWEATSYVSYCRHLALIWGGDYLEHLEHNYHLVIHAEANSDETFINLWQTDGIFAYFFGGHGAVEDGINYGFAAANTGQGAVSPNEVHPPYKLQAIGAFCCESALPITYPTPIGPNGQTYWITLKSTSGMFLGYDSDVWWGNFLSSYIQVNPQPIPP